MLTTLSSKGGDSKMFKLDTPIFATREGGGAITVILILVTNKLTCLFLCLALSPCFSVSFSFFLLFSHFVCNQSAFVYFCLLTMWLPRHISVLVQQIRCAIISFLQWTRIPTHYATFADVKSVALMTDMVSATNGLLMYGKRWVITIISWLPRGRRRKKSWSFFFFFLWVLTFYACTIDMLICIILILLAVVSTVAASLDTCWVTYSTFSLIVSISPFVSPVSATSAEPSRKRERSGLSSSVTKEEMWAEFQKFWLAHPPLCSCSASHSGLLLPLPDWIVDLLRAFIRVRPLLQLDMFPQPA